MDFFCEKFQNFDQLFSREISRTFVMECVNMGLTYVVFSPSLYFGSYEYVFK